MADLISILLVEDDVFDIEAIERALGAVQPPIFSLSQVATFREALQIIKNVTFHIVILDLGLPDTSGLGGLKRLIAKVPDIPILVMTGLDDDELALEAIELGAQEFISKGSLGPLQLVRSIRHAAKRKRCAMKSSVDEQIASDLEAIVHETNEFICLHVDRLKKTDLSKEQHSLVIAIDDKAKSSSSRVNALCSSGDGLTDDDERDANVLDH